MRAARPERAPLPLLLTLSLLRAADSQSPWSGDMHPSIGFPPGCDLTKTDSCAPSYDELKAAGALWTCPRGDNSSATCGAGGCVEGTGDNPTCAGKLDAEHPCCCPKKGCAVEPLFNYVVGVCKGHGCACGGSSAKSCNDGKTCSSSCNGLTVPCCFGQDVTPLQPFYNEGTHALINYLAAYQFDVAAGLWRIQEESSFNTDGSRPTFDMMRPQGGLTPAEAWLAPQPGGAVFWSLGYYPAGVRGVGPPGAMFVMSTEDWFAGTWYMLNQVALDRGPGTGYPESGCATTNDNCWASGNSGEMDFLEAPWNKPSAALLNYTQSYSTQNNQAIVYVAVVDSVGNWVYRIPAGEVESIWPGLGRKAANATVQAYPSRRVDSVNPGNTSYGMTFTSNCQAKSVTDAQKQQCIFNGDQGFCGNWMALMVDTHQLLFPGQDCVKDVRGGAAMPWCACMVGKGDC